MKNAVDINRIKCYNTNRKPRRLRRKDVKDMMKHEEMITLIGNMFINAYVAGDRKDLDSFRSARADRDRMFDEIRELYAELEQDSYNREQLQVELNKALHKLEGLQRDYEDMRDVKDRLLLFIRSKAEEDAEPDEEVPDHHDAFDAMFPGCTPDDLPFPEVEGGESDD